MLLSIVIPVYNNEKTIKGCIESCVLYTQNMEKVEIIVVNDCSTDNTLKILEKIQEEKTERRIDIIIHHLSINSGPSVARNVGMKLAKGKYIAFLDSDDDAISNRFEKQIDYLENNKDVGIVISALAEYTEDEVFIRNRVRPIPSSKKDIARNLLLGNICSFMPTILMRNEVFFKVGGFNKNLRMLEDKEYMLRCIKYYNIYYFTEPLIKRRITLSDLPKTINSEHYFEAWDHCFQLAVNLFPYLQDLKKEYYRKNFFLLGKSFQRTGNKLEAIKFYWRSKSWKSFLGLASIVLLPKKYQIKVAQRVWKKK